MEHKEETVLLATEKPFAQTVSSSIEKMINNAGFTIRKLEGYETREDLLSSLIGVSALIVRSDKIDEEVINAAINLKIIVRAGAGWDNIDTITSSKKGIVVMNTPGQNANAVAELVLCLLIFVLRDKCSGKIGEELKGKSLGLFGFGNVSKRLVELLKSFDLETVVYDPFVDDSTIERYTLMRCGSLDEVFRQRIVSLHVPLTNETKGIVGKRLLEMMPIDGILVNTSRKELIVETDLLNHLKGNKRFRYITDVQADNQEILLLDNVTSTDKKMGAQTLEANSNCGVESARTIIQYFKEGDMTNKIN